MEISAVSTSKIAGQSSGTAASLPVKDETESDNSVFTSGNSKSTESELDRTRTVQATIETPAQPRLPVNGKPAAQSSEPHDTEETSFQQKNIFR